MALGTGRGRAAGAAGCLICDGGRPRRGSRGPPTVPAPASTHGVPSALVPSEHSSGPSVRRGGITNAGNPHARRLLAEAAWAYQGVPRIGRQMLYRQEALPKPICAIAWKAQLGLTSRFRKLVARGKAKPKVATAIARELTGFIWAIAREVPAPPA